MTLPRYVGSLKSSLKKPDVDDAAIEYTGGDRGWAGDIPRAMLGIDKMRSTGYDVRFNSEAAIRHTAKALIQEIGIHEGDEHMKYTYDDEADVRTTALIRVMALFFVGIMIIAATTSPIATGTKEGERAPALEGKFYNGSGWSDFNLESYWDAGWQEGDISGQWVVIEFMDTDCPYCVQSAEDMGINANDFSGNNPQWDGAIVNFIASATELDIGWT